MKRSDENRRAWMAGMQNIPSNQIAWIIRIPLHGSYESLCMDHTNPFEWFLEGMLYGYVHSHVRLFFIGSTPFI